MPRTRQTGTEPPSKRVKLDKSAKGQFIFTSADEIRRTFRTQEQDSLVEGVRSPLITYTSVYLLRFNSFDGSAKSAYC